MFFSVMSEYIKLDFPEPLRPYIIVSGAMSIVSAFIERKLFKMSFILLMIEHTPTLNF